MNCIIFACYLPSTSKRYVLEEIFSFIKLKEKNAKVFIGIQHSSIPETEEILRKIKGNLKIETKRVSEEMMIDSDASSFLTGVELYSKSDMNFDNVYFLHTKSITTGHDYLRKCLLEIIFNTNLVEEKLKNEKVGSFGPCITFIDTPEDIEKMSCPVTEFFPSYAIEGCYTPMEYFYPHTFYIIKNHILKLFIDFADPVIFQRPIQNYSDRYFFERDFPHIVDMLGFEPSFKDFFGNASKKFITPTHTDYTLKLKKWRDANDIYSNGLL